MEFPPCAASNDSAAGPIAERPAKIIACRCVGSRASATHIARLLPHNPPGETTKTIAADDKTSSPDNSTDQFY